MGTIVVNRPFQKLSWDITGPLPVTSAGYKYILVITDLFSKWVEAFPLRSTDSQTLANIFVDEIVCRYGVPESIHSDQGANLTSEIIKNMCDILGMDRTRTTAYHPQGNGLVERLNRTIKEMLAKVIKETQTNWDVKLPKVLLAYRTAIQDSTGFTPFRILFGRSPSLPVDHMLALPSDASEPNYSQFIRQLKHTLEEAYQSVRQSLKTSHSQQKKEYDKNINDCGFRVGDMVYLHAPAVKRGRNKKLTSQWTGPYTVTDRISRCNVRIHLVGGTRNVVVHVNRLKPCHGAPQLRRRSRPVPQQQAVSTSDVNIKPTSTQPLVDHTVDTGIGGYTSLDNGVEPTRENDTLADLQPNDRQQSPLAGPVSPQQRQRPQRQCGPPIRYGNFRSH